MVSNSTAAPASERLYRNLSTAHPSWRLWCPRGYRSGCDPCARIRAANADGDGLQNRAPEADGYSRGLVGGDRAQMGRNSHWCSKDHPLSHGAGRRKWCEWTTIYRESGFPGKSNRQASFRHRRGAVLVRPTVVAYGHQAPHPLCRSPDRTQGSGAIHRKAERVSGGTPCASCRGRDRRRRGPRECNTFDATRGEPGVDDAWDRGLREPWRSLCPGRILSSCLH